MKIQVHSGFQLFCLALTWVLAVCTPAESHRTGILFPDIGSKVAADSTGDALAVTATAGSSRLHCTSQRLVGYATAEGLWLESTELGGGRLRLIAEGLGRQGRTEVGASPTGSTGGAAVVAWEPPDRSAAGYEAPAAAGVESSAHCGLLCAPNRRPLANTGVVETADKRVRFRRPGLDEEYAVNVDGVRQDFVVTERPDGTGELWVELALTGARADAAACGARLTLDGSGRVLAYSRLRVEDATGRELTACLEVLSVDRLAVRVADASATYPVRIDPTFSDDDWVSLNPGMPGANYPVYAVAADGSGNVYVGGSFYVIGTVVANYIAKWDGSNWSALGSGMNRPVSALAVSGANLYAGGRFTTAGGVTANSIARWDGSNWSALGSGVDGGVSALAVSGANLYVGGEFWTAGGVSATNIARWNGSAWSALGSGMNTLGTVKALVAVGADIYAGGEFATAGGVTANGIAKWDGSTWSALSSGMGGAYPPTVNALAVSGTVLYAAGGFGTAGGVTAKNIAKWDGGAWSALGTGMDFSTYALAVSGTDLYAGGSIWAAEGVWPNNIAKWDGRAWSALGAGLNDSVGALAVSGTNLYAVGWFATAGGVAANHVAKWDGSAWSALGSGMGGGQMTLIRALAVGGTNLYAGGEFITAGGVTANYVAKWDGSRWSALGSGMGGHHLGTDVDALAVSGTNLYAGGSFWTAGGVSANNIAKWDGRVWSALGSGMGGPYQPYLVQALAVSGTDVYAGGRFTNAGGVTATNIAKWDGSTWSALGSGIGGPVNSPGPCVNALAVNGANLYAGGLFTTAGGMEANCIAKWDGSTWSALGSGMGGAYPCVYALAVNGTDLYAGGDFIRAGGVAASCIAKWDGSAWSALAGGMDFSVNALTASGNDLYAGGWFRGAGGELANRIAKWDGTAWSALGTGIDNTVRALAADGLGHLFLGGDFYLAGTKVSPFVVQANIGLDVTGGRFDSVIYSPVSGFSFVFRDATLGQTYRIQRSPSLAADSWTDVTNFTYTGPTPVSTPSAVAVPARYHRAVTP